MTELPPNMKDRLLTAIRRIILQENPNLTYAGLWEYTVASTNEDGSVNATATDPTIPLPNMNSIPLASLTDGGVSAPSVGATFLVEFSNLSGCKYAGISASHVDVATIDATDAVNIGPTAPVNLGSGSPGMAASPAVPGGTPKSATVVSITNSGGLALVESSSNTFEDGDSVDINVGAVGYVSATLESTIDTISVVDATHFVLQNTAYIADFFGTGTILDISYIPPAPRPATPAVDPSPPSKDTSRVGDGITVWLPMGVLNGLLESPESSGNFIPIAGMPMQVLDAIPGMIVGGNTGVQL